jgi:hypothetical protein
MAGDFECWKIRRHNQWVRAEKGRATNTESIVLAVNPARAGTHGVARVTATYFNPILLIV